MFELRGSSRKTCVYFKISKVITLNRVDVAIKSIFKWDFIIKIFLCFLYSCYVALNGFWLTQERRKKFYSCKTSWRIIIDKKSSKFLLTNKGTFGTWTKSFVGSPIDISGIKTTVRLGMKVIVPLSLNVTLLFSRNSLKK